VDELNLRIRNHVDASFVRNRTGALAGSGQAALGLRAELAAPT
jgi:hypothetical protein